MFTIRFIFSIFTIVCCTDSAFAITRCGDLLEGKTVKPPRQFKFFQVDAFTDTPLNGNPCAIVFDADALTAGEMLKIAQEMNLSETSFVMKSSVADFKFRYFTPGGEVPLAGHPTIATIHSIMEQGLIAAEVEKVSVELQAGVIEVKIERPHGAPPTITMSQISPQFLSAYSRKEVAQLLSLEESDIPEQLPIQTVSTGTPMLMVPLKSRAALEKIQFKALEFGTWMKGKDFFSMHVFCLEAFTCRGYTAARHFSAPPEPMEDPFTGSATGAMASYLWKHGILKQNKFIAEQGHLMGRPGEAHVEITPNGAEIESVRVGGSAVTVLTGYLRL